MDNVLFFSFPFSRAHWERSAFPSTAQVFQQIPGSHILIVKTLESILKRKKKKKKTGHIFSDKKKKQNKVANYLHETGWTWVLFY